MWLIEALKRDCDVTVVVTGEWDLAALNAFYGTKVCEDEVKVRIAPIPFFLRNLSVAALRGACYQRFARQIAAEYDVRISAYNPTDWGFGNLPCRCKIEISSAMQRRRTESIVTEQC